MSSPVQSVAPYGEQWDVHGPLCADGLRTQRLPATPCAPAVLHSQPTRWAKICLTHWRYTEQQPKWNTKNSRLPAETATTMAWEQSLMHVLDGDFHPLCPKQPGLWGFFSITVLSKHITPQQWHAQWRVQILKDLPRMKDFGSVKISFFSNKVFAWAAQKPTLSWVSHKLKSPNKRVWKTCFLCCF